MTESLTYTVTEAARLLGVSRGVAYAAVKSGEIPSVRICRRIVVPRHALLALLGEPPEVSPNANDAATNGPAGRKPEETRHERSYR